MKQKITVLILGFLLLGNLQMKAQNDSKSLVEDLLQKFIDGKIPRVNDVILPSYVELYNVSGSDYKVNSYSPVGFSLEKSTNNGLVVAKIWGQDRKWVHRLTFLVAIANGKVYFVPGKEPGSYKYIDPWYKVETNIVESATTFSDNGNFSTTEAKSLVDLVLYDMVNKSNFSSDAIKYIAPSYFTRNRLSSFDYNVNSYAAKSYEIMNVYNDGKVIARIYGDNKTWGHELEFKVVKENGLYYAMPGGHTDNKYVHPWYVVKTNVIGGVTKNKDAREEIVIKILDKMTYDKTDFAESMRLYIAPSYFTRNRLNAYDYKVNSYSPVGYEIVSNNGNGTIVARIWGSNKTWVHELTFRIVSENSLYYAMPGKHYTGTLYVDPWYSVVNNVR